AQNANSESDVLLYVKLPQGANPGSVNLHYDLSVQGTPGEDTLSVEFSPTKLPLAQGTVYFADGQSTATIYIPIQGDDSREFDETMQVSLTASSTGTTIVDGHSTSDITIINDDDLVTMDSTSVSSFEGNSTNGHLQFTISRADASSIDRVVSWHLEGLGNGQGAATAADFVDGVTSGTVTILAGETNATIDIAVAANHLLEPDKTFRLAIDAPEGGGYTLSGSAAANGKITNDDVGITLTAVSPDHLEGDSGTADHVYTVTRTGDLSQTSDIDWSVCGTDSDGTLVATASDFAGNALPSGTIHFDAGSATAQITVTTAADTVLTGDRGFTVTLANGTGDHSDILVASAGGKIIEDDSVSVTVDPADLAQTEGTQADPTSFSFHLTRSGDTSHAAVLNWSVILAGGESQASAADFSGDQDALGSNSHLPSGTVTFDAGSDSAIITIDVVADSLVEPDESFTIRLQAHDASVAPQDIVATIVGDDMGFAVQSSVSEIMEGNSGSQTVTLTFVRAGNNGDVADYSWDVSGAANAADFTDGILPGGNLHFNAGQSVVTATLSIAGDSVQEPDETFVVNFRDGESTLSSTEITIKNDDATISVEVDKSGFVEGSFNPATPNPTHEQQYETVTYTVSREGNLAQSNSVNWHLSGDGVTAADFVDVNGAALSQLPSGTVTFNDGETVKTIELYVSRDSVREADEVITLTLDSPSSGSSVGTASVQTTVIDDDAEVRFAEGSRTISHLEGNSAGSSTDFAFTVERVGNIDQNSTVHWHLAYDGGANAADFTGATSGSLSFNNGDSSTQEIHVNVSQDRTFEADEGFHVVIDTPSLGTSVSGDSTALGTILNDDTRIRLASSSTSAIALAEHKLGDPSTDFTWTLERDGFLGNSDTVSYQVVSASGISSPSYYFWMGAANGNDFVGGNLPSGTVTFAPGESTQTLTVKVAGDDVPEDSEGFAVLLSNTSGVSDFVFDHNAYDFYSSNWNFGGQSNLRGIILRDEARFHVTDEQTGVVNADGTGLVGNAYGLVQQNALHEGDGDVVTHWFRIYRDISTAGEVSVDWQVTGGRSSSVNDFPTYLYHNENVSVTLADFVDVNGNPLTEMPHGSVSIPDGQSSVYIKVYTKGDTVGSDNKNFAIGLSNPSAGSDITWEDTVGYSSYDGHHGYIANDDPLFSVASRVINETDGEAIFTVTRSGDISHAGSVDWKVNFSGTSGYVAANADFDDGDLTTLHTINFAAGQATQTFTLHPVSNDGAEAWAEQFNVVLENPVDAVKTASVSINKGSMENLLIDSQHGSVASISSAVITNSTDGGHSGYEGTNSGGASITYTIHREGDTSTAAQVAWQFTGSEYYTLGNDVSSITGNTNAQLCYYYDDKEQQYRGLVGFAAGDGADKTVTITFNADNIVENDELYTMRLVDGATLLTGSPDAWTWNYGANHPWGYDSNGYAGVYIADSPQVPDSGNMWVDPAHGQAQVTVLNDDIRLIVDTAYNQDAALTLEGDSGITNFHLSITRYGRMDNDVTISYQIRTNGSADSNDVVVTTNTLTLAGQEDNENGYGSHTYDFDLPVIKADITPEPAENFTIRLASTDNVSATFAEHPDWSGSATFDLNATILNDDTSWSVAAKDGLVSQLEGGVGQETTYTFVISRPCDGTNYAGEATVDWAVAGSGAYQANGADFTGGQLPGGTEFFAEGEYSKEITVTVKGDNIAEHNENFTLTILGASHGQVNGGAASVEATIRNDDSGIMISDAAPVREGDSGSADMEFTVTRVGRLSSDASATWTVHNGTTDSADFTGALTGQVNFAAVAGAGDYGEQSTIVTVKAAGDTAVEADETFTVGLSGVSAAINNQIRMTASGTIQNDDTAFSILSGTPQLEGDLTGQEFTITRSAVTVQDQTVNWAVTGSGGNPTHADDFSGSLPHGSVTFTGSETTKTIHVISSQDSLAEANETYTVTLSAGDGTDNAGSTFAQPTATGAIINDDGALTLQLDTASVQEGSGSDTHNVQFTIFRSGNTTGEASVDWTLSGDHVGEDFANLSGQVHFAEGDTEKLVTVAVTADTVQESNHSYSVTLGNASGAQIIAGAGSFDGTIVDDDSTVSIHGDASGLEGDSGTQHISFTLDRSGSIDYATTVGWHVEVTHNTSDNADAADFGGSLPSGTATLAAGQGSITLDVPISGDCALEGDETFTLLLDSPAAGLTIATASATGTILNDDDVMSIANAGEAIQLSEGSPDTQTNYVEFEVLRSGSASGSSSVGWHIVSPAGNTTNGSGDFSDAASGTVTFNDGETSRIVSVAINPDSVSEADEPFVIELLSPGAGSTVDALASSRNLVIINDDMDHFSISAATPSLPEGNPSTSLYTDFTFTITRENPTTSATVDWSAAPASDSLHGTAFAHDSGTVSFAAGELTETITVSVLTDTLGDFDRSFDVIISNPQTSDAMGAVIDTSMAEATVVNDDPALLVNLAGGGYYHEYQEDNGSTGTRVQFTVTRTGDATGAAAVDWHLEGDGANPANVADFGGYWPSGTVVFADGQTEKTVTFQIGADHTFEQNEGFAVVLSNGVNADIIQATDFGVIMNNDNGVSVAAIETQVNEGDSGATDVHFTISAEGVPYSWVTAHYLVEGAGAVPANAEDFVGGSFPSDYVNIYIDGNGYGSSDVTVQVQGDTTYGSDETFRMRIDSADNASIVHGRANVVILNDDSQVAISQTPVVHNEGDSDLTAFHFTITRVGDTSRAAVVDYQVESLGDNPATATDFANGELPHGTIAFAAGETSYDLVIQAQGDTTFESSEDFAVRLLPGMANEGENVAALDPSATIGRATITNDDSAGLRVTGLVTTVIEGNDPLSPHFLSYEIVRDGDNTNSLLVNYELAGAAAANFTSGLTGSITLAAGQSRGILNIEVAPNSDAEPDRSFTMTATAAGGMPTLTAPVSGHILDDDSGISISAVDTSQAEGNSGVTDFAFTVTRSGNATAATDVAWSLSGIGIDAADITDFAGGQDILTTNDGLPSGVVHFADLETSQTIHIGVNGDSFVENDNVFRVMLDSSSDSSQAILTGHADAVIANDDTATSGNDIIHGGSGVDVIHALGGDDIIYGHGGADLIFAGDGNDTIYAGGGAAVMYGGSGNDTFILDADTVAHLTGVAPNVLVDGGLGIDSIKLDGHGITLDLATLDTGRVIGVEKIDLTGDGANRLLLTAAEMLHQDSDIFGVSENGLNSFHQLLVNGDSDDTIIINDFNDWTDTNETFSDNGITYEVWNNDAAHTQLLISQAINGASVHGNT
ncbi:MAG: hypothetical protein HXX17_09455, partial [Geobacteraceae bacterium]|nr:hypothetical protein [Geobacteraceae bacterium]